MKYNPEGLHFECSCVFFSVAGVEGKNLKTGNKSNQFNLLPLFLRDTKAKFRKSGEVHADING